MAPLGPLARAMGKSKRKALPGGVKEKAQNVNYVGKLYELTAKKHKNLHPPIFR